MDSAYGVRGVSQQDTCEVAAAAIQVRGTTLAWTMTVSARYKAGHGQGHVLEEEGGQLKDLSSQVSPALPARCGALKVTEAQRL